MGNKVDKLSDRIWTYISFFRLDEIYKTKAKERRIEKLENRIIKKLNEDPTLLTMPSQEGLTIGMWAAKFGLEKVVLHCLENHEAATQQVTAENDYEGKNIGMFCVENRLKTAMTKALENPVAAIQQDRYGRNIGHYIANEIGRYRGENYIDIALKSLENREACNQNTSDGKIFDILYYHINRIESIKYNPKYKDTMQIMEYMKKHKLCCIKDVDVQKVVLKTDATATEEAKPQMTKEEKEMQEVVDNIYEKELFAK